MPCYSTYTIVFLIAFTFLTELWGTLNSIEHALSNTLYAVKIEMSSTNNFFPKIFLINMATNIKERKNI